MTTESAALTLNAGVRNQREAWLVKATRRIIQRWAKLGVTVPTDVQLSCGFPGGGSARRRIGECWPRSRSAKNINQVFVSPLLDEPMKALDVLGHELLHAADNCESGHGGNFGRLSAMVGYSGGKNSAAVSQDALRFLARLIKSLGPYPHGALVLAPKKQKANAGLHKFACCEDVLYSTEANVEKHGAPHCRMCGEEMTPAKRRRKKVITTI